jgi:aspartyl-tRNA(Asn)/glutamyl-tRNA(Gln) amidotransferase subunit C
MARIDSEELRRIAHLARLRIDPAEAESLAHDLARVLDYVAELSEVDTTGVEPTAHVLPIAAPLRDDRVEASRVPRVLEGEEEG